MIICLLIFMLPGEEIIVSINDIEVIEGQIASKQELFPIAPLY